MEHLLDRIKKIEALIAGAATTGEKNAAESAKERILAKYPELEILKNPVEFQLSTSSRWNKKLLIAICRKYGVKPFRYHRQKHTTVMINVNEDFLNKVLWKEYEEYSKLLNELVDEITNDLIGKIYQHEDEDIIHGNLS